MKKKGNDKVQIREAASSKDVKYYTTDRLREDFLIEDLFIPGEMKLVYSHIDRIIIGAVMPLGQLKLTAGKALRANYFLERREMGIINIGGKGTVTVDGKIYTLAYKEGMYIGKGAKDIVFSSIEGEVPAKFYFNSAPAHTSYPTVMIKIDGEGSEDTVIIKEENKIELGCLEESNHRVITKYILPGQVESCQLVMGMTALKPGSVWNTMPCHTHDRRMEVYLYFEMSEDAFVMHYMGEAQETRHLVVRNEEAVISPSWSIHAGSGSRAYTFIWGMVGENQVFTDMDAIENKNLR